LAGITGTYDPRATGPADISPCGDGDIAAGPQLYTATHTESTPTSALTQPLLQISSISHLHQ